MPPTHGAKRRPRPVRFAFVALGVLLTCPAAASAMVDDEVSGHPEANPYAEDANAMMVVDAALRRASEKGKRVILVMGANWCHDSRGLAGLLETDRFTAMLDDNFEVVYVHAGQPRENEAANLDVARRFGIDTLIGTPNVFILTAAGERLNAEEDVLGWRDAASRDPDDVYEYFAGYAARAD